MEKGDKDKARENYKKAIALQPGNLHSKQMLDKLQE
jgi:predicted negative regulator of RcsB-dependent stress response